MSNMENDKKTLKSRAGKFLSTALAVTVCIGAICLAYTFPSNLVLHLFREKVDKEQIDSLQYDYGQLAGLPAGEGVTVLESVEQLAGLDYQDYFTFETDSIIPLDLYELKSATDKISTSGRSYRTVRRQRPTYTTGGLLVENVYNRYYLVKLPDDNYVLSYLDDSYYVKYLLKGRVSLPLGRIGWMTGDVKKYLAEEIEEYGLDERVILDMFAEEDYEEHKTLHQVVSIAMFFVVLAIYIAAATAVSSLRKKKAPLYP